MGTNGLFPSSPTQQLLLNIVCTPQLLLPSKLFGLLKNVNQEMYESFFHFIQILIIVLSPCISALQLQPGFQFNEKSFRMQAE